MALKLSKNSGLTDIVSGANPITTQHPIAGSTQNVTVYLFNDDATKRYESISIDPTDATGTDESTWIELSADNVTFQAAGAALSVPNISTANSGTPIYVRVTTPSVGSTQNKTDIKLTTNYTEFAV